MYDVVRPSIPHEGASICRTKAITFLDHIRHPLVNSDADGVEVYKYLGVLTETNIPTLIEL